MKTQLTITLIAISLLNLAAAPQIKAQTAKVKAQTAQGKVQTAQAPQTAQAKAKSSQIQQILKAYHLPGIQLLYTHGNHVETYNIGNTGDSTHAVTDNTIFEAASLSKCVFAYIVFRLYDRGLINLDTSLLAYVGGKYDRFDPNNPAYAKITALKVLRHTTGLPNWGDSAGARLIFPPDSCFSYSGEGYLFLQHVIEKITGKTLEELAQEEVFKPLKMTGSSYTWQTRFDSVSAFGDSPRAIKDHSTQNAAYSLLTNAHDYTLFLKALAIGRGLKPATHKLMLTPAATANWFGHKYTEATDHIYWGLGIGLQEYDPHGQKIIPHVPNTNDRRGQAFWHWGDNGDFKAFYIVYPETKESLIYFVHDWRGLFATADLYSLFFGDNNPCWAILWSGEGYHSPASMKLFTKTLEDKGFDNVAEIRTGLLTQKDFDLSEEDINEYGFILMDKKRHRDAVAIFKLNLSLHPQSANAFDSLAQGYEALGQTSLALENFKHSLELNPKNDYAAKHIKSLETSLQTK